MSTKVKNIRMQARPNLSGIEGTAGNAMIDIIQRAESYTDLNILKTDFMNAINNSKKISVHKKRSYRNHVEKIYKLDRMLLYITNIFCAADNLELDW